MKYFVLISDLTTLSASTAAEEPLPTKESPDAADRAAEEVAAIHEGAVVTGTVSAYPPTHLPDAQTLLLSLLGCSPSLLEKEDSGEESTPPAFPAQSAEEKWGVKICLLTDNEEELAAAEALAIKAISLKDSDKPLSFLAGAAFAAGYDLILCHTEDASVARSEELDKLNAFLKKGGDTCRFLLLADRTSEADATRPLPFRLTNSLDSAAAAEALTEQAALQGTYYPSARALFSALLERSPADTAPDEASESTVLPPEMSDEPDSKSIRDTLPLIEEKEPLSRTIFEWIELFVISLTAVLIIMTFFVRHSPVVGDSMNPTLHEDDVLVLSSLTYTPQIGDIVIVQSPHEDLRRPLVKRIVAVGGQTLRINFETWEIFVDGKALDQSYLTGLVSLDDNTFSQSAPDGTGNRFLMHVGDFTMRCMTKVDEQFEIYETVVPEGHVFVLGDNRNNSKDSRTIGFVDERHIIGDVKFRLFPLSDIGAVD